MLFNSMEFFIFFPITVLIFCIIPKKVRYVWLLIASYYFYMQWNPVYILLLFTCTVVTYFGGIFIEKQKNKMAGGKEEETGASSIKKKQTACLVIVLFICLGILGYYKYADFIVSNVNRILSLLAIGTIQWEHSILLPAGISFFTLQALGYLIDVYRGEIYAEKNFLHYALFLSFFPQLVAGPIERSKNLLVQLHKPQAFSWNNFRKGILLMLWGLFLKMVIADRAAIIVNTVYEDSTYYGGLFIVVATLLFAIQIYCDFYGYSIIAKGAALIMGIYLMDNFQAPYLARNVKEFWRRWHISLSGWFRDYLYIPLGGNRKGWLRKQLNLLLVFGVSGLWHGASVAFIVWGGLNGAYQVLGDIYTSWKKKLRTWRKAQDDSFGRIWLQRIITFGLVCFAWIFFRAGDMSDAIIIVKNMCHFNWWILFDGSLYILGVSKEYFHVLLCAILLLFAVDLKKYKGVDVAEGFLRQEWWFRTLGYVALVMIILVFGCYGVEYDTQQFIYFQF